jgi:hypothetical protein
MDQERSGELTGNSNSDDKTRGAQTGAPPPTHTIDPAKHHGFTLQQGGRNAVAGAAERIGRLAGTAKRQMRRGLELVHPIPASTGGRISSYGYASGSSGQTSGHRPGNALEQERDGLGARMMENLEEEVAAVRHEAGHIFDELGELSELARERLLQVRERLHETISRSRRVAAEHPVRTMAALAGFCFAFGLTLRYGGSRRR